VLVDLVADAVGRGVKTTPDVIAWLNAATSPVSRLASLAPRVSQAADAGDAVAVDILARAGLALAELAVAAACRLWPDGMTDVRAIACCGGVWAAGHALEAPFAAALAEGLPRATIAPPRLPAVAGAVLLAMGAAEAPIAQAIVDRLAAIR
jgi:N-acetylglucosamine kinase-like BadF-type ATPase